MSQINQVLFHQLFFFFFAVLFIFIQDMEKQRLHEALNMIQSMKTSIDSILNNREKFEQSLKQKDYLNAASKWNRVKVAPISTPPYELMKIAAYPFPPERIPLKVDPKNNIYQGSNPLFD